MEQLDFGREFREASFGDGNANNQRNRSTIYRILKVIVHVFYELKKWISFMIEWFEIIANVPLNYLKEKKIIVHPDTLAEFNQSRGWKTAVYKGVEFHPNCPYELMALLTYHDIVVLHDERSIAPTKFSAYEQKNATCMAFRPWSHGYELAVGCAAGIFLWTSNVRSCPDFEIRDKQTRTRMQLLKDDGHVYVTSLQWNEDGTTLVSSSLGTNHIIMWDPDSRQKLRLIPHPGNGCSFFLLKYTPNFRALLCGQCDVGASLCVVGGRSNWRRFQVLTEHKIQTAGWTCCSTYILFVDKGSTILYSCKADEEMEVFLQPEPSWTLEKVTDLKEITTIYGEKREGGEPHTIVMDPFGIYIAIIFKDQPFVLLALLISPRGSRLIFRPLEYICYEVEEADKSDNDIFPICMGFAKPRIDEPHIRWLVIVWSSERVQRKVLEVNTMKEALNIHSLKNT
ncbi:uncharacterized protein Dana_GF15746 [Drosophila ananassae]|uniref:Aladin n=1 Tax=Drosophila ananassae TaxID=7217 RepID=B3MPL7_DROAN|nr:aladin [Drosophila ananassae]EDV32265.2 uncharacterized protein Dana_GF15746 [Drosophila ananassae]